MANLQPDDRISLNYNWRMADLYVTDLTLRSEYIIMCLCAVISSTSCIIRTHTSSMAIIEFAFYQLNFGRGIPAHKTAL